MSGNNKSKNEISFSNGLNIERFTMGELISEKNPFLYKVSSPYSCMWKGKAIYIPKDFKTDGATAVPDKGISWLYHDYLYTTHRFSSGEECTRRDADNVMIDIMREKENINCCLTSFMKCIMNCNCCCLF